MDFITENKFLVPAILIIFFIIYMSYSMSQNKESLDNIDSTIKVDQVTTEVKSDDFKPIDKSHAAPTVNNNYAQVEFPKDSMPLKTEDLLPKYDEANEFTKENPASQLLKEQNFLISGYHMGVNTQVQSNKIAYHDLRSAPVIPKQNVGPFLNSSYETFGGSSGRRFFELGA